jgi:hypothetical protein
MKDCNVKVERNRAGDDRKEENNLSFGEQNLMYSIHFWLFNIHLEVRGAVCLIRRLFEVHFLKKRMDFFIGARESPQTFFQNRGGRR